MVEICQDWIGCIQRYPILKETLCGRSTLGPSCLAHRQMTSLAPKFHLLNNVRFEVQCLLELRDVLSQNKVQILAVTRDHRLLTFRELLI